MTPVPLRLKHTSGWFAAGREVAEALMLLSDAGFKLFVWLCLHADRSSGTLRLEPKEIGEGLGKTEVEIAAILEDLFLKGICRRGAGACVQIADRFWPYQRAASTSTESTDLYVAQVKQLMLQRACVRTSFAAAAQKLAAQLHHRGLSIERVEQAIHLGCLRKYVALLNHQGGTPITSLHYFLSLFEEVENLAMSKDYWRYLTFSVEKLERQWLQLRPALTVKQPAVAETK